VSGVEDGGGGYYTHNVARLSFRDQAAIAAMAAMIGTAAGPCLHGLEGYEEYTSAAAFKIADAMVKARATGAK